MDYRGHGTAQPRLSQGIALIRSVLDVVLDRIVPALPLATPVLHAVARVAAAGRNFVGTRWLLCCLVVVPVVVLNTCGPAALQLQQHLEASAIAAAAAAAAPAPALPGVSNTDSTSRMDADSARLLEEDDIAGGGGDVEAARSTDVKSAAGLQTAWLPAYGAGRRAAGRLHPAPSSSAVPGASAAQLWSTPSSNRADGSAGPSSTPCLRGCEKEEEEDRVNAAATGDVAHRQGAAPPTIVPSAVVQWGVPEGDAAREAAITPSVSRTPESAAPPTTADVASADTSGAGAQNAMADAIALPAAAPQDVSSITIAPPKEDVWSLRFLTASADFWRRAALSVGLSARGYAVALLLAVLSWVVACMPRKADGLDKAVRACRAGEWSDVSVTTERTTQYREVNRVKALFRNATASFFCCMPRLRNAGTWWICRRWLARRTLHVFVTSLTDQGVSPLSGDKGRALLRRLQPGMTWWCCGSFLPCC